MSNLSFLDLNLIPPIQESLKQVGYEKQDDQQQNTAQKPVPFW